MFLSGLVSAGDGVEVGRNEDGLTDQYNEGSFDATMEWSDGRDHLDEEEEEEPEEAASSDEEDDEEDGDDVDDDTEIHEFGDHPMMQRVQTALQEQLAKEKHELIMEIKERAEELKRLVNRLKVNWESLS